MVFQKHCPLCSVSVNEETLKRAPAKLMPAVILPNILGDPVGWKVGAI